MKKNVILLALSLIKIIGCFGQSTTINKDQWQDEFFKSEEVTLPLLIDAAIKNSVQLERLDANKIAAGEQLKIAKQQILSGISFGTGYSYGTRIGTINSDVQISNSFNAFSMPARATYNVGVNMSVGLVQIIGRKHNIKQQEMAIEQVKLDKKLQERQIREYTINLYKEIVLSRTVMLHAQDALQSAKVNKNIADKRFKDGELQVEDQIAALGYYNQAVLAYEQAKTKYETSMLMLEELIGKSVKDLMTSK